MCRMFISLRFFVTIEKSYVNKHKIVIFLKVWYNQIAFERFENDRKIANLEGGTEF